jgi:hypothetical protein
VFVTVFRPLTTTGAGETGDQELKKSAVLSRLKPMALVVQLMMISSPERIIWRTGSELMINLPGA